MPYSEFILGDHDRVTFFQTSRIHIVYLRKVLHSPALTHSSLRMKCCLLKSGLVVFLKSPPGFLDLVIVGLDHLLINHWSVNSHSLEVDTVVKMMTSFRLKLLSGPGNNTPVMVSMEFCS